MTSLLQTTLSTIVAILAAMAIVAVIEAVIPLHTRRAAHRAHLGANLALTFIALATNIVLNGLLMVALLGLDANGFGLLRWVGIEGWLAFALAILVLDFATYVAHVAMHAVPTLWRVHCVHHADPVVDVTTTIRQHPLEGVIRYAFLAAFACVFGVGIGAFIVYRTWSVLNGLLEHANIRVPRRVDTALALVTTWPNMHKIHHSRETREWGTNYGNLFSWFDRLFGTYTPSWRGATVACGVAAFDDPSAQTTVALLAMPFRADRR